MPGEHWLSDTSTGEVEHRIQRVVKHVAGRGVRQRILCDAAEPSAVGGLAHET